MKLISSLILSVSICAVLSDDSPIVTLSHGGQLRGKNVNYKDGTVDVFLGVRFAKPPVGTLRFKKPQPVEPWKGVQNATRMGNYCPQHMNIGDKAGQSFGDEDCLFLDVWTPLKSKLTEKKAVMVWIHGGAYQIGTGQQFMHPFIHDGDVIMVSINYRLGVFGFLNDGSPGSGNFGLWDQRQALIWVQENIADFGGDVDRVTIFGESAGAGSVNCQSLSPKNNGLFHRVIQQSGACLAIWSHPLSVQDKKVYADQIKGKLNCTQSLYDCFNDVSTWAAIGLIGELMMEGNPRVGQLLTPTQDGDFFRDDVLNQDYNGMQRFDYMAGFNGQEGLLMLPFAVGMFYHGTNYTLDKDGIREEYLRPLLSSAMFCGNLPDSVNLCTEYLIKLYKMDEAKDGKEIAYLISLLAGELYFSADTRHEMNQFADSSTDKTLYSYHFTETKVYANGSILWPIPKWLKKSADHGDDVIYVFKAVDLKQDYDRLAADVYGDKEVFGLFDEAMFRNIDESHRPVSDMMFTLWVNFAKTGNPNKPVKVKGVPEWVPYTGDDGQLMELISKPQLVKFPQKERSKKLYDTFLTSYKQYKIKGAQLPPKGEVEVFVWTLNSDVASKLIYGLLLTIVIFYVMSSYTKQLVTEQKPKRN